MKNKPIQELASKFNKTTTSESTTTYLLEETKTSPHSNSVARIGENPIGVTSQT